MTQLAFIANQFIKAELNLYQQHNFKPNQRKWLDRLAKKLVHVASAIEIM